MQETGLFVVPLALVFNGSLVGFGIEGIVMGHVDFVFLLCRNSKAKFDEEEDMYRCSPIG